MYGAIALLGVAIVAEVAATAALPRTEGFTAPLWTVLVVSGYALAIWLLTIVVREVPVSVAYAVWSGAGTALVAGIGWMFLGDTMTPGKVLSLALIVTGVIGLNLAGAH